MIKAGQISETQRRNRAVVDAVRAVLGKPPLYSVREHSTTDWLAQRAADYYSSRESGPKRTKGK